MERIGSRVDRVLSNVVRIAYVVGLGLAFISYFSSTFVDSPEISWGLGIGLGVAFILHEFLVQRRIISLWNKLSRLRKDADERKHLRTQFGINLGMGAVIFVADVFFGWLYYSQLLMHQNVLDPGIEAFLRPAILGVLFLMSSMLAPVEDDPAQIIADTHADMLVKLSRETRHQWNTRIERAVDEGRNLATVAADIMQLSGDVDRAQLMDAIESSLEKAAPGTVPVRGVKIPKTNMPQLRLKSGARGQIVDSQKRTVVEGSIGQSALDSKVSRPMLKLNTKQRVRNYIKRHPEASDLVIAKALGVDRKTVAKYRTVGQDLDSTGTEN